jgi:hypothetical protein
VGASVGTFVVINDDGWIATAAHLFELGNKRKVDGPKIAALEQEMAAVRANTNLSSALKARQLRQLERKAQPDWLAKISYWWAHDGVELKDVKLAPIVDLAIGRLDPFPRDVFRAHALLKNPATGLHQGSSLCKLGFPFPQITATYDAAADRFQFDAAGLTYFPLDGIFTRILDQGPVPGAGFRVQWVEMSTPGLKGQSGGPVYDAHGRLWGIQSSTSPIPLGFRSRDHGPGR